MRRARLLVTDLDGTLLDGSGRPHARDREALLELKRRGVATSIATGRMLSGTRWIAAEVGIEGAVGCLDGGLVARAADGSVLEASRLEGEPLEHALGALRGHAPVTFAFAGDRVHHDQRGVPFLSYVQTWSRELRAVDDPLDPGHWEATDADAFVALADGACIERSARALEAHPSLEAVRFPLRRPGFESLWGMVVRARGRSKATALQALAVHYGVTLEETVVVGDWLNDVPMMRAAGRSFAMGQAPPEVQAAATDVLSANLWTGGGILEAARRCGLL